MRMGSDSWTMFMMFYGSLMFVVVAICLVMYVLGAFAYMKLMRRFGYDKIWLAWIPFGGYYAMCEMIGDIEANLGFNLVVPMHLFKFWWVLIFLLPLVPVIGGLASTVWMLLCLTYTYSRIYSMLDHVPYEQKTMIALLSAFIGIIPLVKFLMIQNNNGNRGSQKTMFDVENNRWE